MGLPPWITMPADPTRGINSARGISAAELNWGMLFAFGRPYLSDLFNFEPDAAVMRRCFRGFSARKCQTRHFDNPCRRAMLPDERPAGRTSRIPRLFRGLELSCDVEHLIRKNC